VYTSHIPLQMVHRVDMYEEEDERFCTATSHVPLYNMVHRVDTYEEDDERFCTAIICIVDRVVPSLSQMIHQSPATVSLSADAFSVGSIDRS
jgi:hypothetical protein